MTVNLEFPGEQKRDEFDIHPAVAVSDETSDAIGDLYRPSDSYIHFPWSALDRVVGGMPEGEVCYVAAFSSSGKTTFLTSMMNEIFESTSKRVYFMGLESKPKTLRTHWAAKRLGFDAGELLSGEFLKRSDSKAVRDAVEAEIHSQNFGEKFERIRFSPTATIDARNLKRAADAAADFGADIFIIDHVDHIDGSPGRSDYGQSREVNQAILTIAQEYGFLMLPATQLNNEAARINRIALHLPPQPQYVKMGGHKREVATWMLALYRPLKVAGMEKETLKAVNAGSRPASEILEPNTMAVLVMKHRFFGNREGSRVYLRVENGMVKDVDQAIYTASTVSPSGFRMNP
jgi:KaiC/GvpD/RAD55 family RecA-like ATPase